MIEPSESWYAVKIYTDKPEVMKYLKSHGVETFVPILDGKPVLANLVFVRCLEQFILSLKASWFHQLMVYRDAEREKPQAISQAEMDNFRMVLNIKDQEFIPLDIEDKQFFQGQKVKVLEGPLKGAVGLIKRIKGDRRLVVSVSGIAAVATSFVKPEWLEAFEE